MDSHTLGEASANAGGNRRPLSIEVGFGRASSTVSSDTGDWFADLASPAASEEMKGGVAKQRPSFLAGAPHPSSRWEWSRKDSDVPEGDLEQGAHNAPAYKRTGSLSSLGSVSSGSHHMSVAERWKNMAAQIVYSPVARFYYAFMICITLFEISVTLYDPHNAPHTRWFIGLELFMVAMLMNEVSFSWHSYAVSLIPHAMLSFLAPARVRAQPRAARERERGREGEREGWGERGREGERESEREGVRDKQYELYICICISS